LSVGTAGGSAVRGARKIRLTSRVVCLADVVTAYYEQGGENAAIRVAWQRSGTQFDPAAALRTHVRQGRLDADAVQAVLEAAGHRAPGGAASSPLG
jgi:hypothetical protein